MDNNITLWRTRWKVNHTSFKQVDMALYDIIQQITVWRHSYSWPVKIMTQIPSQYFSLQSESKSQIPSQVHVIRRCLRVLEIGSKFPLQVTCDMKSQWQRETSHIVIEEILFDRGRGLSCRVQLSWRMLSKIYYRNSSWWISRCI